MNALRTSLRVLQRAKHFFQFCNSFGYPMTIVIGPVCVIHQNTHSKIITIKTAGYSQNGWCPSVKRKSGERNGVYRLDRPLGA